MDTPNTTNNQSKFIWLIGFLILLALIGLVVKFTLKPASAPSPASQNVKKEEKLSNGSVIRQITHGQLPDKFPKDLPQEKDASVKQNYTSTTVDGRLQAVRATTSKKSLEENLKLYRDYLTGTGWKITSTLKQTGLNVLSADKGNTHMQVSIRQDLKIKEVSVKVSLAEISAASITSGAPKLK